IVAQAGRKGAVTVATNMAGRGTDILLGGNPDGLVEEFLRKEGLTLETATPEQKRAAWEKAKALTEAEGEEVRKLGGLHVIGTERHEARRIDNQLRGRAGRQGDPGSSRFFLSLEDELLRRFGPVDRIRGLMERYVGSDVPLQAGLLDRTIEGAQTRVEGYNFDARKHTVEFDDVMNKQRQIIYADRKAILDEADMRERVLDLMAEEIQRQIDDHLSDEPDELELTEVLRAYRRINPTLPPTVTAETLKGQKKEQIEQFLLDHLETTYAEREKAITPEVMRTVERRVMLGAIDRQWVDYLTAMDELRQNILLQAYAQKDPLVEFKRESFRMFDELKENIARDIVYNVIPASFQYEAYLRQIAEEQARRLATAQVAGDNSEVEQSHKPQRRSAPQIGRNDPCPCGSGKKFKHCHLGREHELANLGNATPVTPPAPAKPVRPANPAIAEEAAKIKA
ncbi:MAG: SEC-C metal-binding domain-containing protein, partial [Chloroflexus sp.]